MQAANPMSTLVPWFGRRPSQKSKAQGRQTTRDYVQDAVLWHRTALLLAGNLLGGLSGAERPEA
jgi:hypothetical protein